MREQSEDRSSWEELDDSPPGILENAWFWFWQINYWIGYGLISLIFVPWALAMHVVLAIMALVLAPFLFTQLGRDIFIYVYVVTVAMPGKYIWFNALMRTKRRGRVWDYEMGKPRALPRHRRRRISLEAQRGKKDLQTTSAFFTDLPSEVRMQIYKEIFVGDSCHLHVVLRRSQPSRSTPPDIKVRGYFCNREHEEQKPAACGCMVGLHAHHDPPHASEVLRSMPDGGGRLAILQTCRKAYEEAIDLMYSAPTFCFNNLEQPPFFLRTVLPRRLAQIRNIQLCWKQSAMGRSPRNGSSLAKHAHRVGQCTFCNLTHWLRLIQKYLTGVRQIEIFMYLDKKMPVPSLGQSWMHDLFALQKTRPGRPRKLNLKVFCSQFETGSESQEEYTKAVKEFIRALRKELAKMKGRATEAPALGEGHLHGKGKTSVLADSTEEDCAANTHAKDTIDGLPDSNPTLNPHSDAGPSNHSSNALGSVENNTPIAPYDAGPSNHATASGPIGAET